MKPVPFDHLVEERSIKGKVYRPKLEIVGVQGKPYIFTNLRIDRKTLPEGFIAYDVRDDCDGQFWQIQKYVMVNHWGTIIGRDPVVLDHQHHQYWCPPDPEDEDLSSEGFFIDDYVESAEEYLSRYDELQKKTRGEFTIDDTDDVLTAWDEHLKVSLENIGEGKCGDYDPNDPDDVNYLRFTVQRWDSEGSRWEDVEDASYRTLLDADAPTDILLQKLKVIWDRYKDAMDSYPEVSVKKIGEELSWLSADGKEE